MALGGKNELGGERGVYPFEPRDSHLIDLTTGALRATDNETGQSSGNFPQKRGRGNDPPCARHRPEPDF